MLSTEPGGFAEAPGGTLVHFIDLDLHAEALHTEVNDPVVLIHGLGCNWHHWSRQIGWIAHSRRVVAVDVRGGAGKTRWTRPGWTTADMAADIHAVVTELGLCRPAVVGCSIHPRYTAGISEAQRPGPFRRFRATGFQAGTGGDYGSCPHAHASPRPNSPLSRKFIKYGW